MAEDKKTVPGPAPGKDLTSKIATAYRSLPPEQREKTLQDAVEVHNPELDNAFDKMVDMYKVRRPERENAVVSFPAPPTLRIPKEAAQEGEDYECPECGHDNPGANQFCGMCGAAREDAAPPPGLGRIESEETDGAASVEGAKHHHHYYHHHHYRNNPYLLVAVVLLLAVIAWQQWQAYKQQASVKPAAPAVPAAQVQQAPVQSQPAPTSQPAIQTPVSPPAKNSQPLNKPAPQSSTKPPIAPTRQGEPPGPQVRAPDPAAPEVAIQPTYQPLTNQAVPSLPSFSATPPKPAAPEPRFTLSQEVSAGRLTRTVPPVYPVTAKRAGLQGEVVLQAVIAKDGSVRDVKVVTGNPTLAEAAMRAVRQWRYQPATLNGQPVEAETLVQVNFKR